MASRIRTLAIAILIIGISSLVIIQSLQTSVASNNQWSAVASLSPNALRPLQNANSTASSQIFTANTTSPQNSTATASQTSPAMQNETTAISYLQYQMTSMNDELIAMSSSVNSINQQTGMVTLLAEAGLIVGILAVIAAIAVARRADAMYHETPAAQPGPPPPPAK